MADSDVYMTSDNFFSSFFLIFFVIILGSVAYLSTQPNFQNAFMQTFQEPVANTARQGMSGADQNPRGAVP